MSDYPKLHTWEELPSSNKSNLTDRFRVDGGWIYRFCDWADDGGDVSTSAVLVLDSLETRRRWNLEP